MTSSTPRRRSTAVNPKVEIVAVADVFKNKADDAVKAFSNAKHKDYGRYNKQIKITPETTFGGLNAYEQLLKTDVNLVILATPPGFRPYHLEAAIKAGKNIFCEKPVCGGRDRTRGKVYGLVEESKKKNLAIVAGTQAPAPEGLPRVDQEDRGSAIGDDPRGPLLVERPGHLVPRPGAENVLGRRVPTGKLVPLPVGVR